MQKPLRNKKTNPLLENKALGNRTVNAISSFNLNKERAMALIRNFEKTLPQVKGDEKAEQAVRKTLESLRAEYSRRFGRKKVV